MIDWRSALKLVAILGLGTLLVGCGTGNGGSTEEATPTPILQASVTSKPTYKVEQGSIVDQMTFTGRIAPVQEETLYFRVDGRVSKVTVQQGAKVLKGTVLAELDMGDLQNQEAQAEITLQVAQLKLKGAQQSVVDQRVQLESALRSANLRLEQAKVRDPKPSILIAQGNLEKADAALQQAQSAYDKKKDAPNIGALPESLNLQKATVDNDIAKAQYDLALQSQKTWEYDILLLQESVTVAQANVQKLDTAIDPALAQDVAKAQLAVDRLNTQIANARLIASNDGEITSVYAIPGKTLSAYSAALVLASGTAVEISADLLSNQVSDLSVGQTCIITMSNYPSREFHGVIRRIPSLVSSGAAIQDDRTTRVSFTDADVTLERGALAKVAVTLQQKDKVLSIPVDGLRTFQGKDFVIVLEGDTQRRVPVKIGIKTDERVEITDGLTLGQIVVGP